MKILPLKSLLFSLILLVLAGCGKPTSSGGGPPQGDFPTNVVGAPVTVEPLKETLRLVGTFEAPDEVIVVSKIQGGVEEIAIQEGQKVEKGQLIARMDDDKIQARLLDARARKRLAVSNLERAEELRKTNSISSQEVDEAIAESDRAAAALALLEEELEDSRITAPMPGRVGEILVSKGQIVPIGQTLTELIRTDPIEVRFEVPELYVGLIEEGLKVEIATDAYRDQVFEGTVSFLAPALRNTTRTLPVKANVPNPDGKLRPGMFGNVELVIREVADAMFVPESAVMQQGTQNMVIVRNPESFRSEFRPVQVGVRQGGRMQIVSGLSPEDLVVAEGTMKMFFPGMLLNFTEDSRNYGLEPSMAPMPEPAPEEVDEETTDEPG